MKIRVLALRALIALSAAGCGGGDNSNNQPAQDGAPPDTGNPSPDGGNPGPDGSQPGPDGGNPGPDGSKADGGKPPDGGKPSPNAIKTIFLILMENHNWSDIQAGAAPYINGTLLPAGAHAEQYFDNPKSVHPSEPNYLWLEAGDNLGVSGSDPDPSASNHQSTTSHLVYALTAAGYAWRSYQEGITGTDCPIVSEGGSEGYAPKHNPMVFFDDVSGNPPSKTAAGCIANVRPYGELAADLAANTVAQYNFITPNLCDDMHDACGGDAITHGDTWLSTEVPKIQASAAYTNGGAIFITWDESEGGEFPIGMIVLSPLIKSAGYSNNIMYYHSSMLRTVQEVFDLTPLIGDAANRPSLSDLFKTYP